MRGQPARSFSHCHIDNKPFDEALQIFGARSTKFKATIGSPRSGQHFMLKLATDRYAIVRNYDDFPYSLEFSLEINDPGGTRKPSVHMTDLRLVLSALELPLPDKSNDGFLRWLPDA
jgi:hypothetical protein